MRGPFKKPMILYCSLQRFSFSLSLSYRCFSASLCFSSPSLNSWQKAFESNSMGSISDHDSL